MSNMLTIGEISRRLGRPDWAVRRAVDRLDGIPRAGLYRLVPADRIGEVERMLGGGQ